MRQRRAGEDYALRVDGRAQEQTEWGRITLEWGATRGQRRPSESTQPIWDKMEKLKGTDYVRVLVRDSSSDIPIQEGP